MTDQLHDPCQCPVCLKHLARLKNGDLDRLSGQAIRIALDLAHISKSGEAKV